MTKRKVIVGIAAILLIGLLVPVAFADTTPVPAVNNYPGALTDDQVNQIKPILDKMLELKKELMQKYVDMGEITQEDADARIEWMEQNHNYRLENGFAPGYGRGYGRGGFGGGFRGGCGGGGCGYYGAPNAPAAPTSL